MNNKKSAEKGNLNIKFDHLLKIISIYDLEHLQKVSGLI